ncbi:MAG: hypothetical protein RIC55_00005, partial [Pirellulaceae bacterium]
MTGPIHLSFVLFVSFVFSIASASVDGRQSGACRRMTPRRSRRARSSKTGPSIAEEGRQFHTNETVGPLAGESDIELLNVCS